MGHGVDTRRFNPEFRDRESGPFTIGYVGRLTAEKNVRWLVRLEQRSTGHGVSRFQHCDCRPWGRGEVAAPKYAAHANSQACLHDDDLSRGFANMDVLAFPSETETFGLVVLEALASGVPVVAMAAGGPKYTIAHGKTGFVAENFEEFASCVARLMNDREMVSSMREEGRRHAQASSWGQAFHNIYQTYCSHLADATVLGINNFTRSLNDSVPVAPCFLRSLPSSSIYIFPAMLLLLMNMFSSGRVCAATDGTGECVSHDAGASG